MSPANIKHYISQQWSSSRRRVAITKQPNRHPNNYSRFLHIPITMASKAANKRLTREYQIISKNPPPYIVAHPSESNILEWHYILTGPPETPYEGGQYWGTLIFPPDYPFAPPAIRMHTPSGRFQPSTRLCLSISDFHPKQFNPAWEVSTILIGLMSFMTSEEMTTGSISGTPQERKAYASKSRWWNSTGGGSTVKTIPGVSGSNAKGVGNVKAGDGGAKFKLQWPELDDENWKHLKEKRIDPKTGMVVPHPASASSSSSASGADALRLGTDGAAAADGADGEVKHQVGGGWFGRNKWSIAIGVVLLYAIVARLLSEGHSNA